MTEIEVRAPRGAADPYHRGQRCGGGQAVLATAYGLFRDRDAWLPSAARAMVLRETARRMQEQAADLTREGGKPLADPGRGGTGDRWRAALRRAPALGGGQDEAHGTQRRVRGPDRFPQHEPIGVVAASARSTTRST